VNSFLLYCKEQRSQIAIENPTFSNSDVTSQLGKNWRNMDTQRKLYYHRKAEKLKDVSTLSDKHSSTYF